MKMNRTCKRISSLLMASLIVVSSTLVSGLASAANPQLVVDLATVTKSTVDHAAAGGLYALRFDNVPNDRALIPLKFKMIAQPPANPGMLPNGEVRPMGDAIKVAPEAVRNGIQQIQIYMSDTYPNFPQKWVSWDDYITRVDGEVSAVLNSPYKNLFIYIPWNEPDWTWDTTNAGVFLDGYKKIYDRIRTQDTINKTEGPNIAGYDHTFMNNFFTYCKTNNCLPDIVSWHELDANSYTSFQAHVDDFRAIETSLGISHRPISINEYARPEDVSVPGNLIQLVSKFERGGVDSAALPFWFRGGTVGDTFTNQNSVPNGAFWLYKFYADMSGVMVQSTPPQSGMGLDGIASRNDANQQATIVFGGGTGSNDIVVNGFSAAPYITGNAHVQIWKTINTGSKTTKLTAPTYVSDGEYPITNGQITVPMTNMVSTDAYKLVITPSTPSATNTANRYEAEYAQLSGTAKVMRDHTGYSGTGFAAGFDFSNNAKATFVTSVDSDGMYTANLHYSAGPHTNNANRIVGLYVNGKKLKDVTLSGTANWNTWANNSEDLFLLEGINTIEYRAETTDNNDAINLDYLDLTFSSASATVYQAENATLSGTSVVATNHADYNGSGFIAGFDNSTSASVTFNVNTPSSGSYNVALRYAAGEQFPQGWADNRTVGLYVNGVKVKDVTLLGTVTWDQWFEDVQSLDLNAGNNTIAYKAELANNDDSINLDQITVFTNPQVKIEAENAALSSGAAVASDHLYYSGSGFASGFGTSNAAATFTVNAASAGVHQLSLRYSAGTDSTQLSWSINRTVAIYVNNTKVQDLVLPGTGIWDGWADAVTSVTLNAGSNTVAIKAERSDNNDVINLDSIFVNKQP